MKSERNGEMLAVKENIEMDLFSSEEQCAVIPTQKSVKEPTCGQRKVELEHPLDFESDSDDEEELEVQTQPKRPVITKTESPALQRAPVPTTMKEIEIEMDVFPTLRVCQSRQVEVQPSPNKGNNFKWKRSTLQTRGLVVKDVVCLPSGNPAQLERLCVPQGKKRAALDAMGMTARITIDGGWSANQMQSRLAMLFRGRCAKPGQKLIFTYLQGVQGSKVLFDPETPTEGWTGEQVLRISRDGALYILIHLDKPQAESKKSASAPPVETRRESSVEVSTDDDRKPEGQTQPQAGGATEEVPLLTTLRLFRQEVVDPDAETHIQVKRRDLLHCALKEVRRPDFSFRASPIVTFIGEETDGHEGPLREFFRLTLLELQESSVFEGRPGRLFFTGDLAALEDRKYYEAGVLTGWSLAQGGPGPRCLHPTFYRLMCGQSPSLEDFSWSDVVDGEAQLRLKELQSSTDVKLLSPSLSDWVSGCGIPGVDLAGFDGIPECFSWIVQHYIYHRVGSMVSQFKEGMNSCGGLWDMVQSHWEMFIPVMTSTRQRRLTLKVFKQLFTVCYSRPDGPLRAAEEATAEHWEAVLASISDGEADVSLEDLLAFVTGADHLPPLGFPGLISIYFYSQDANTPAMRLPYASTCALELFLPRRAAAAAEDLLTLLSRAVQEALGFALLQTEEDGENCIQAMTML